MRINGWLIERKVFSYFLSLVVFGLVFSVVPSWAADDWSLQSRSRWDNQMGLMMFEGQFSEEVKNKNVQWSEKGFFAELYPLKAPLGLRLEGLSTQRFEGERQLGLRIQYTQLRALMLASFVAEGPLRILIGWGPGLVAPSIDLSVNNHVRTVAGQMRPLLGTLVGLRYQIKDQISLDLISTNTFSAAFPDGMMSAVGGALGYRF